MEKCFGYIPFASELVSEKKLEQIISSYASSMGNLGGEQWTEQKISSQEPLFFFVATGGTEQKIIDAIKRRKKAIGEEPAFLLSHPGNNSLPAAMETLAKLRQDGERGEILFLNGPEDQSDFQRVRHALCNLRTLHALKKARIGLVGAPSDWLVASSPKPELITHRLGPQIIPIDMVEFRNFSENIKGEPIVSLVDSLTSGAGKIIEPEKNDIEVAVSVYLALKKLVEHHRFDAVTLRCFDLIMHPGTTGCFALAQLNDEGTVAGCEGDLVSTFGMLWVHIMLGQIPWMANPAKIDIEHNSIRLAHCMVPRNMIDGYDLRSHFESDLGVGIHGTFPIGPVTLFRIGGNKMDKLWVAEGEITPCEIEEELCRTQVQVLLRSQPAGTLLRNPLGNHLLLARGHHEYQLCGWWEMMGGQTIM